MIREMAMNPSRFDAIATSMARQPSRRQMLRFLGGGGVLAAIGAVGLVPVSSGQAVRFQDCFRRE
jgi:hypothetical protein